MRSLDVVDTSETDSSLDVESVPPTEEDAKAVTCVVSVFLCAWVVVASRHHVASALLFVSSRRFDEEQWAAGIKLFNEKPTKGIKFLVRWLSVCSVSCVCSFFLLLSVLRFFFITFHLSPNKQMEAKLIGDTPADVAAFLYRCPDLNKNMIGE